MAAIRMLFIILACVEADEHLSLDTLRNVTKAVYKTNVSLEENMHNVMSLLCPESVYCACQQKSRDTCRRMQETKYDIETDTEAIDLINYGKKLQGCCAPCYCDEGCYTRGNCCRDMPKRSAYERNNTIINECVPATNEFHDDSIDRSRITNVQSYSMITTCIADLSSQDIVSKCHSPNKAFSDEVTIVSSRTTQTIYLNMYCAQCNKDTDIVLWSPLVKLARVVSLTENQFPVTYEEMLEVDRRSVVFFEPSDEVPVGQKDMCVVPDRFGQVNCDHLKYQLDSDFYDFIESACNEEDTIYKYSSIYSRNALYKNVFCLQCKRNKLRNAITQNNCQNLDMQSRNVFAGYLILLAAAGKRKKKEILNTGVIDVNKKQKGCTCVEWYDIEEDVCRPLLCALGAVIDGCGCLDMLERISGIKMDIRLEVRPTDPALTKDTNIDYLTEAYTKPKLIKDILREVKTFMISLTSETISFDNVAMFLIREEASLPYFYLSSHFITKTGYDTRNNVRDILQQLWQEKHINIKNNGYTIRLGLLHEVRTGYSDGMNSVFLKNNSEFNFVTTVYQRKLPTSVFTPNHPEILRKLIVCEKLLLTSNETLQLKNDSFFDGDFKRHTQYAYSDTSSVMCFDDFLKFRYPKAQGTSLSFKIVHKMLYFLGILLVTMLI